MSRTRTGRFVQLLLLIGAVLFVAAYLFSALARMSYPYQLEWQEGGVLQHVERVLSGKPIYTAPSLEFVPFVYTPFYYYLAALVAKLIGLGLSQLRFVSFACSLGCFALIYRIVRAETREAVPAMLAVGLFAATYPVGGAWLDIARVDSLFLLLLLGTVYLLQFQVSKPAYLVAGVLMALAFQTKQSALFAYPFFALLSVLAGRRLSAIFLLASLLAGGGSFLILERLHGGWYSFYTIGLLRNHPLQLDSFRAILIHDLLAPLACALAASILYFTAAFRGEARKAAWSYLVIAAGMFAIALFSSVHSGGYKNVLIPGFAACAILFGLASDMAFRNRIGITSRIRRFGEPGFYLLAVAQFGLLAGTCGSAHTIPTDQDRRAGDALVQSIARLDGEVLIPRHGYLGVMAGKANHAHEMAMNDVLRGGGGEAKNRLTSEIGRALGEKRFGAIIVDYYWLKPDISRNYRLQETLFKNPKLFWTVTGNRTRPKLLYLPKPDAGK